MPIMLRFIFLFSFFSSTYLSRNSFTAAFILNVLQNELLKALKFENSNKLYTLAYISINENHFQNPYPALLYWWRERLGDNVGILWILGNIRQYCRCCYSNFEIWIRLRFWFLPKLLYQKFIGAFIHPHIIAQCAMMAIKCAKIHREVLFLWLLWRKKMFILAFDVIIVLQLLFTHAFLVHCAIESCHIPMPLSHALYFPDLILRFSDGMRSRSPVLSSQGEREQLWKNKIASIADYAKNMHIS